MAAPGEALFEPLLELRIDVMGEKLEWDGRFKPSHARPIFRAHFEEPELHLILVGDERAGWIGLRSEAGCRQIDSFYLDRRWHNSRLRTAALRSCWPNRTRRAYRCGSKC